MLDYFVFFAIYFSMHVVQFTLYPCCTFQTGILEVFLRIVDPTTRKMFVKIYLFLHPKFAQIQLLFLNNLRGKTSKNSKNVIQLNKNSIKTKIRNQKSKLQRFEFVTIKSTVSSCLSFNLYIKLKILQYSTRQYEYLGFSGEGLFYYWH